LAGASSTPTITPEEALSRSKEVYNPKAVIPHAASLRQASAHCAIFPTAASRRSLGRVSVPVWPDALSGRLPVEALVGHHPTNKLIGRGPIPHRKNFPPTPMQAQVLSGIRPSFPSLSRSRGQVTHVLLTRSPLTHPKAGAFDLHVLSTPPAFVLSQDQTLQQNLANNNQTGTKPENKKQNRHPPTRHRSTNKLDTLLSSQKTPTHHHPPRGGLRGWSSHCTPRRGGPEWGGRRVPKGCPGDVGKVTRGRIGASNRPADPALTCDNGDSACLHVR
jgi:hypothetical protein